MFLPARDKMCTRMLVNCSSLAHTHPVRLGVHSSSTIEKQYNEGDVIHPGPASGRTHVYAKAANNTAARRVGLAHAACKAVYPDSAAARFSSTPGSPMSW